MKIVGLRFLICAAAVALVIAVADFRAALIWVAIAAAFYAFWFLGDTPQEISKGPPQSLATWLEQPAIARTIDPDPEPEPVAAELPADERYTPPDPKPLPAWAAPIGAFIDRIAPFCSEAMKRIGQKNYGLDPLLTPEQSQFAGVINSAMRHHGILIEKAILECLLVRPDLAVWSEPVFRLSHGDTNYHKAATIEGSAFAALPYGDGDAKHRAVQVDLIVFDRTSGVIRAYSIKRNHEDTISAQNLQIVRSLLISYAEVVKELKPTSAEAWTISYYGAPSTKGGTWRITRGELDQHFGCPIAEEVDRATATYRADLQTILNAEPIKLRAVA